MRNIPMNVVASVRCLLEPYGVDVASLLEGDDGGGVPRKYLTVRQASVYCGLSPKTIRDKALAGVFASLRMGETNQGRVLIRKADLDRWLEGFSSRNKPA